MFYWRASLVLLVRPFVLLAGIISFIGGHHWCYWWASLVLLVGPLVLLVGIIGFVDGAIVLLVVPVCYNFFDLLIQSIFMFGIFSIGNNIFEFIFVFVSIHRSVLFNCRVVRVFLVVDSIAFLI